MEIRDVLYGSIALYPTELPILDSRAFQRLRQIRQLGFGENSYPNATHTRYIHSLGAMHVANLAFQSIFAQIPEKGVAFERFRRVLRLAAMLHDVGHGPLSHTTEFAMPDVKDLHIPGRKPARNRKATHEDYTLKLILDSELTPLIDYAGRTHGFKARHVASLIDPSVEIEDDFFSETIDGEKVSFQPILQQLISSEIDADRMDYLRRDSLHAGVSYGQFDADWLVGNLSHEFKKGHCYLALQHRALYAFEDFLISRFHMFLMVYFHYKSVVFDAMLAEYLHSPENEYSLSPQIDRYLESNDAELYAHLAQSKNPWAKRIARREPYRMMIELHSGIPATQTATKEQAQLLTRVKKQLHDQKTHFIEATSTGELSKYFRKPAAPIFVKYDNHYSAPSSIPLDKCTDLFTRYSEKRSITRLYVAPESFKQIRLQGRGAPLRYEEDPSSPQTTLF